MRTPSLAVQRLLWAALFAVAFAFVESAVVIYLRALYYPEGFFFPLRVIATGHITVELIRELSTLLMIAAVAVLAGRIPWERFGFFIFMFGIWDVFFYGWLKICISWPATLFDWDILFLLPLPWIGPVIAPVLVALTLAVCGIIIVTRSGRGRSTRLTPVSFVLWFCGTAVILYSFLCDTAATLHGSMPAPYHYELLGIGLLLYFTAFAALKTLTAPPEAT